MSPALLPKVLRLLERPVVRLLLKHPELEKVVDDLLGRASESGVLNWITDLTRKVSDIDADFLRGVGVRIDDTARMELLVRIIKSYSVPDESILGLITSDRVGSLIAALQQPDHAIEVLEAIDRLDYNVR